MLARENFFYSEFQLKKIAQGKQIKIHDKSRELYKNEME